jgi:hypothetical protein
VHGGWSVQLDCCVLQVFGTPYYFGVAAQVLQEIPSKMMTDWDDKRVRRYYQAMRLDPDIVRALVEWEKHNGEGENLLSVTGTSELCG